MFWKCNFMFGHVTRSTFYRRQSSVVQVVLFQNKKFWHFWNENGFPKHKVGIQKFFLVWCQNTFYLLKRSLPNQTKYVFKKTMLLKVSRSRNKIVEPQILSKNKRTNFFSIRNSSQSFLASKSCSLTMQPPLALVNSKGAQGSFQKVHFMKLECSNKK